jgi:hypothetical protein
MMGLVGRLVGGSSIGWSVDLSVRDWLVDHGVGHLVGWSVVGWSVDGFVLSVDRSVGW